MHHLEADDLLSGLPWFHNEVKTEFNWVQRRAHSHMCGGGASFNLHCKFKYLASRWSELADTMRQKKEGGLLKQSLWVTTQQCASKSITARRWHSNSETRVPFFFHIFWPNVLCLFEASARCLMWELKQLLQTEERKHHLQGNNRRADPHFGSFLFAWQQTWS